MDRIFQAVTDGVAKYLYGWVLPSAIALGVLVFLIPDLENRFPSVKSSVARLPDNNVQQILLFGLATFGLSTLLALVISRPLTQLLEGYFGRSFIWRWLRARQVRTYRRLRLIATRRDIPETMSAEAEERLVNYPRREDELLPTRLGNHLRAAELFGNDAYSLDILEFWNEIYSTTTPNCRTDVVDQRSAFDFYVSAIANSGVVIAVAITVAVSANSAKAYVVAGVAAAFIPLLYVGAVSQAVAYGASLRSLASISRHALSRGLGYRLPDGIAEEREFWQMLSWGLYADPDRLADLDSYRVQPDVNGTAGPSPPT